MNRNRMWTTPNSIAMTAFALLGLCTTNALADEPAPAPVVVQQPAPAPVVQQPPTQNVTVEAPRAPVAQTQTTAAPYVVAGSDRSTERTIEHRPNTALLKYGAGAFVLSYGASVVAGAVSDRDEDKRLFIPVVGPWLDLANRNCDGACGGGEDVAKGMIVTSGVVQGAGILMAIGSLIIPESTSVSERTRTAKAEVHVTPLSFAAGAGVGAVGRF